MNHLMIIFSLFLSYNLQGQHKYDYTWIFGSQFDNLGTMLSFNDSPLQIQPDTFFINLRSGVSYISDESGNLQYYSSGCQIYNGTHNIVSGAEKLMPEAFNYQSYCDESVLWYPIGDQGMVFLPFGVGSFKVFYKLYNTFKNELGETKIIHDTLYMTSIENGVAQFVDVPIYVDTLSYAGIGVVKHENNVDYWVVTPHDSSDVYVAIQISKNGVIDTVLSENIELIRRDHNGVIARFSPDGITYIGYERAYLNQAFKVFSFERSTGVLDFLFDMPHPENVGTTGIGGIEFSSSGRYLYCSTPHNVYQYDLEAANVENSKVLVAKWETPNPQGAIFDVMQRGPDCRIYITSPNSQSFLHVIMYPDRPGLECEVVQQGLTLPYKNKGSLPYFPNYRLGTGEPVCDSTLSLPTSVPVVYVPAGGISLWPNPAQGIVYLGISEVISREATELSLFNMMGQQVWHTILDANFNETSITIPLDGQPPGLYVVQIIGRHGSRWIEKLVVE